MSDETLRWRSHRKRLSPKRWFVALCVLVVLAAVGVPNRAGSSKALVKSAQVSITATGEETGLLPGDVTLKQISSFRLRRPPLGLTFRGPRDGWMALGSGEIAYFKLAGNDLVTRVVADGLSQPRGIFYSNGRLYVSDMSVPCKTLPHWGMVRCQASDFPPDEWPAGAQVRILLEGNGRVLRYDTQTDGSLTDPETIVDHLPIATSDHAVNQITASKDGWLYMSIGNVDSLYALYDRVQKLSRPHLDMLGTIVRFHPDGSDLSIFARGTRNVYDIAFDDKGSLYGVDNDGPTQSGYRAEEVIRFKEGANYGYPFEGTYGPFKVRTDGPVWTMLTVPGGGSAGLLWAPEVGLPTGFVSGGCGQLTYLRLRAKYGDRPWNSTDEKPIAQMKGCVPVVRATSDKLLVVGTVGANRLMVFRVAYKGSAS